MPIVEHPQRVLLSKKAKLMLVIFGVLLVGGGIAFNLYLQQRALAKQPPDVTLTRLRAGRLSLLDPATQSILEKAAPKAVHVADRIALWEAASSSAIINKHYDEAVNDALKAEALGTNHSTNAIALARAYQDYLHDNANALKYYRIGLKRTQEAQKAGREQKSDKQIQYLEAQIKALETQSGQ